MNLTDRAAVRELLTRHGFTFSKAMGQNFLVNPAVCPRMAEEGGAAAGVGAGRSTAGADAAPTAKRSSMRVMRALTAVRSPDRLSSHSRRRHSSASVRRLTLFCSAAAVSCNTVQI